MIESIASTEEEKNWCYLTWEGRMKGWVEVSTDPTVMNTSNWFCVEKFCNCSVMKRTTATATATRPTEKRAPKEKEATAAMKMLIDEALKEALCVKEGQISVLGLAHKLAGVVFHEQLPHSGMLTVAAVRAALEKVPEAERKRIDVLDLAFNHLLKHDLKDVASLLPLLPNVSEVDLSGCSLTTTRPDMILPFTRVEALKRLYVFGTQLGMACAAELYHNPLMEESDLAKILFVKAPAELEQGRWMHLVRREHHAAVRAAHHLYYKEASGETADPSLPRAPQRQERTPTLSPPPPREPVPLRTPRPPVPLGPSSLCSLFNMS
jgi:hypothetical protein